MFCLMLLLFGAVVFISGTDPKKLKDFINKNDQSDKFKIYGEKDIISYWIIRI